MFKKKKKDFETVIENKNTFIDALTKERNQYYCERDKYKSEVSELNLKISKLNNQIFALTDTIKSQQAVIDFLTKQKFEFGEDIEFAAIKRYRGWDCLYLNGQKIDIDRVNSLSIYCDANEPIRISEDRV